MGARGDPADVLGAQEMARTGGTERTPVRHAQIGLRVLTDPTFDQYGTIYFAGAQALRKTQEPIALLGPVSSTTAPPVNLTSRR